MSIDIGDTADPRAAMAALLASGVTPCEAIGMVAESFTIDDIKGPWRDLMAGMASHRVIAAIDEVGTVSPRTANVLLAESFAAGAVRPRRDVSVFGTQCVLLNNLAWLDGSGIPEGVRVDGDLNLTHNPSLKSLPDGLHVGGGLFLTGSAIVRLPKGLVVGGVLWMIDCCEWDGTIPEDAIINGLIFTDGQEKGKGIPFHEWRAANPFGERVSAEQIAAVAGMMASGGTEWGAWATIGQSDPIAFRARWEVFRSVEPDGAEVMSAIDDVADVDEGLADALALELLEWGGLEANDWNCRFNVDSMETWVAGTYRMTLSHAPQRKAEFARRFMGAMFHED
jgi:hypothetical protein